MSFYDRVTRKWREIAVEAPDESIETEFPVPDGMRSWKNSINEFCVVATHYSSDPDKRNDEWYKEACKGLRQDQIERELEINFESKAGTKAFPYLELNGGVYRIDPPDPIPPPRS